MELRVASSVCWGVGDAKLSANSPKLGPGDVPRLLLLLPPPIDDDRVPGVLANPIPNPGVVGLPNTSLPARGVVGEAPL